MLVYNHPLVSAGDQLSKLNSINKQISLLAADIFYAMDQAGLPKASPEAICLGVGLKVVGLLASIGINDNNIISGIPNFIASSSNLWYVVKKSCEATFMRIAGFFCNYLCTISCYKV